MQLDDQPVSASPQPRGRLELTWTNKDQALLADDTGGYTWVPRRDHRVAEVRLLDDLGSVGEPDSDNLLISGDALNALTALAEMPAFAQRLVGKVRLIYIDPPFNTGQAFANYDDALEHSVWLTMMRDRLVLAKRLLAPNGSLWLHLDDTEAGYARVMLDEVFGRELFVANVVWEKADSPRMDAALFSQRHDHLLVYRASTAWTPNPMPMDPDEMAHFDQVDEDGERYRRVLLRKWGANSRREDRPNLWYPLQAPDGTVVWPIKSDGTDGYWRWKREKFDAEQDRIEWVKTKDGWQPYVRQMARDAQKRPPETLWPNTEVDSNRQGKAEIKALFRAEEPFATPKPEKLLERVLFIGSDPGDLVLDYFAGSGTTAAVAHKMGRRWVAIERSDDTVDRYTRPRLEKVVKGDDPGGITSSIGWLGGGGFRHLRVGRSMYLEDHGVVVLADWATNGQLARAVAVQLGFTYEEDPPFAGRRGRLRLAVLDGHTDERAVASLVAALEPGERLSLCATSLDPAAGELLMKSSPGSQARVVPEDLLLAYRIPAAWRSAVARSPIDQVEASPDLPEPEAATGGPPLRELDIRS